MLCINGFFIDIGVFTSKEIKRGEYICVYKGEILSPKIAEEREKAYKENQQGCFRYYYRHNEKNYWYVLLSVAYNIN